MSPSKRKATTMPTIHVELGLKKTIVLPQVIKIPVALIRQLNLPRWVSITRTDQVVPKALRDWMLTQRTYKSWFAEGKEVVVDAQSADEAVEDLATDDNNADNEAPSVVETGTGESDDEPIIEEMTVPQLKAFAEEHNIDLKGNTSNLSFVQTSER